ncbi:MAG: hypothetical protein IJ087_10510 [Eggerthellaceae bacterium]|nr:hypothetical protein [Eggerthellaceae bacterium]
MSKIQETDYWVPEHARDYLSKLGFHLPLEAMEGHIRAWHGWMSATGDFYDYRDADGFGRIYEVHRRSIHPAMRVCREWGSLLLNDKTSVVCEEQVCTDWLAEYFRQTGFMPAAQNTVVRAFGLGTGAWALWVDADAGKVRIRHYDARMVLPLTWDEEGVSECAFVTRAFYRGKAVDQLQMHLRGGGGLVTPSRPSPSTTSHGIAAWDSASPSQPSLSASSSAASPSQSSPSAPAGVALASPSQSEPAATYRIVTVCFDEQGNIIEPAGVCSEFDTGCTCPTFSIVKPAIDNTRVDMSPYGQSVFADAVDAIQAVDLTFDALINEIDVSKMRVFLSDVLFDRDEEGNGGKKRRTPIPFGKQDCTVFRKVMSSDDMIQDFAPALRTNSQAEAFRISLQMLGDLCGFGISYFDFDDSRGYVKTATEVSSDNSALMRNIARHEHALEMSLAGISRAVMQVSRCFGVTIPDEGEVRVEFDDSIIQDTAALKAQDMSEVGVTLAPWEYRARWYGESEAVAKERARAVGTVAGGVG